MSFHTKSLTRLYKGPLQQHPAFAAALTHLGRPPMRVWLPAGDREVLVMRRRFGPLKLGVISRADIHVMDLARLRDQSGCRWLIVNAESGRDVPGLKWRHGPHVAELNLRKSASCLRRDMAQKWRNRLNRAARSGLSVSQTELPAQPDHWLLRAEARQQRAKRYRGYPPVFSAAFAASNRGQARLFEARDHGAPVAAMLFLCHGSTATYQIGWSGPDGRRHSAHHLLLWRAMLELPRRGITRLDLGLVDTQSAPGLARFKLGSGATCRALGGSYVVRL